MKVSDRIQALQYSPIRKLSPYADAAKQRGVKVYHLNIGQPDIRTPDQVYEFLASITPGIIAYGKSEGEPELREACAQYLRKLGEPITAEDVMITTGGSEALQFLFWALCDEGDEAVITEPFYTNVRSFAGMAGVKLRTVTSTLDEGFALPPIERFEEVITPKTRMILLNSPNNPTGHIYTTAELEAILRLCEKHDLVLAVDEVYREFCYDGRPFSSILSFEDYKDRVVCVDSFSKRFSMCGARIGEIITRNHEILQQCLKLGQARLCPPVIEEGAAAAALSAPDSYVEDVRRMYESRRDCIVSELRRIPGVRCTIPGGAFYLIAGLPVEDAEDFCLFMLRDFSLNGATVMMAPANGFYLNPELGRNEVRLAYVLNEEDLRQAAGCLKAGLEAYRRRG